MNIMDKLFLLDAYALIYRSYYAFMKAPRINSKGLNTSCVMGFCNTLNEILTKEKPTHIAVAFDHGKTFRHEAFPAYKAQREETPEDIKLSVPIIKNILEAYHIPILQVDGFEADDIIGTVALKAGEMGIETYMLTPDKDYAQLVRDNVFMFRPRHGGGLRPEAGNYLQPDSLAGGEQRCHPSGPYSGHAGQPRRGAAGGGEPGHPAVSGAGGKGRPGAGMPVPHHRREPGPGSQPDGAGHSHHQRRLHAAGAAAGDRHGQGGDHHRGPPGGHLRHLHPAL